MNIFGISNNSILYVKSSLKKHHPRLETAIIGNDNNENMKLFKRHGFKRIKILFFTNTRALHSSLKIINGMRSLVIIFDAPLLLAAVPNIELLDSEKIDDFNYRTLPLNMNAILSPLINDNIKKLELQFTASDLNLLPSIIKGQTIDGFLDKFNTFVYAATDVNNRTKMKEFLVKFIIGDIKLQELLNYKINVKAKELLEEIIHYVNSKKGSQLRAAMKVAINEEKSKTNNNSTGRRTVAYQKIADKYEVDKFDLRNLLIIYRKIN